jgi:hypothetical protein
MRSLLLVVAAGLMMGWLPITALESGLPQSAIPYNGDALRTAIADGMSRAGATVVSAESPAPEARH